MYQFSSRSHDSFQMAIIQINITEMHAFVIFGHTLAYRFLGGHGARLCTNRASNQSPWLPRLL